MICKKCNNILDTTILIRRKKKTKKQKTHKPKAESCNILRIMESQIQTHHFPPMTALKFISNFNLYLIQLRLVIPPSSFKVMFLLLVWLLLKASIQIQSGDIRTQWERQNISPNLKWLQENILKHFVDVMYIHLRTV